MAESVHQRRKDEGRKVQRTYSVRVRNTTSRCEAAISTLLVRPRESGFLAKEDFVTIVRVMFVRSLFAIVLDEREKAEALAAKKTSRASGTDFKSFSLSLCCCASDVRRGGEGGTQGERRKRRNKTSQVSSDVSLIQEPLSSLRERLFRLHRIALSLSAASFVYFGSAFAEKREAKILLAPLGGRAPENRERGKKDVWSRRCGVYLLIRFAPPYLGSRKCHYWQEARTDLSPSFSEPTGLILHYPRFPLSGLGQSCFFFYFLFFSAVAGSWLRVCRSP